MPRYAYVTGTEETMYNDRAPSNFPSYRIRLPIPPQPQVEDFTQGRPRHSRSIMAMPNIRRGRHPRIFLMPCACPFRPPSSLQGDSLYDGLARRPDPKI